MEKWFVINKNIDYSKISRDLQINEIVSKILVNRDIWKYDDIETFLNPLPSKLYSPSLMMDLEKGAKILRDKIENEKRIRIVGDFDVDGIMSVYILFTSLKRLGAKVDYIIPDRVEEGYGINSKIIREAKEEGIDTIITCDNGISAIEEVQLAKDLGLTIIITDHHDVPYVEENNEKKYILSNADAIINPKRFDCDYPFKHLCGAAVAYKLIEYLYCEENIPIEESHKLLEFVSIATICDVVDLIGENRIIVKKGLSLLNDTDNIGLKALISESSINKDIGVYHIGFVIGPTINATGRLDSAHIALDLLLCEDKLEAEKKARYLRDLNEERKSMTELGIERIIQKIDNSSLKEDKVLVVYDPEIHESIAGIIAGRIKDLYYKPTIVLTKGKDGIKGSGRSIPEFNIFEELGKCKDILGRFGGHPMAAGVSLMEENILEFRKSLNNNTSLTEDELIPKIYIDTSLPIEYINYNLIHELDVLEPFGKGNPRPLFGAKGLKIKRGFILGANKNVIKLILKSKSTTIEGIIFGDKDNFEERILSIYGDIELENMYRGIENNITIDILYNPGINEYMGKTTLQVIIQNYRINQ